MDILGYRWPFNRGSSVLVLDNYYVGHSLNISKDFIIALAFFLLIFFFIGQVLLPLVYDIKATDKDIRVVVFGVIPVLRIPYADVSNINVVSYGKALTCLNLPSRILGIGKPVLIQRRRGIFRRLCVTPRNPEAFVQFARMKMP